MRKKLVHESFARITLIAAGIMISAGIQVAFGGDWTAWRGPAGNGTTPENGWAAQALTRPGTVAWQVNVGRGHSAVAVQGDRLYTMGLQILGSGDDAAHEETVYCLDAGDGHVIWRYAYPEQMRRFPGPGATPVLDGARLFALGRSGQLYCLDAGDGRVIWRRHLVEDGLAVLPDWGFCASPVVDGERLILNAGQSGIALNKNTGTVIWASETKPGQLATPVLFERNGTRLAAILASETLYAVDPASGAVRWTYEWRSYSDPIIVGNRLLLTGAGRGKGSALLDLAQGAPKLVWQNDSLAGTFQTGVPWQGHVYGFGDVRSRQPLQCVEIATGELKWSEDLGQWGSLIIADGKLLILDGDGDLVIAEASPEEYREIASARVLNMKRYRSYEPGDPKACWTAPVLANGRLYARDTWGDLVCVDLGGRQDT